MSTPTAYQPPDTRPRVDVGLLREIAAVFLLIVGAAGLIAAGFMWATPAGIAAASALTIAAGIALGIER